MSNLVEISLVNKDSDFKKQDYYVLDIEILIEMKLKTKINVIKEKWARSNVDKFSLILFVLHHQIKIKEK